MRARMTLRRVKLANGQGATVATPTVPPLHELRHNTYVSHLMRQFNETMHPVQE